MKKIKRTLLVVALLLVGVVVYLGVQYFRFMASPDFYRAYRWEEAQRGQMAQQAMNKMLRAHEMAVQAQAAERQRLAATRQGRPSPSTVPVAPVSQTFTEEELNAFFTHWMETVKSKYEQYLSDPGIFLHEGRLVLAGTYKDLGAVLSLHFSPRLDDQGRLRLDLEKIMGGKVSIPKSWVGGQLDKLRAPLDRAMPAWRKEAHIKPDGLANREAAGAAMAKLLLAGLRDEPADPVLFIPTEGGFLPVLLTKIQVVDKSLAVEVKPMDAPQRQSLLQRIKSP
jgi:hypothetical protein